MLGRKLIIFILSVAVFFVLVLVFLYVLSNSNGDKNTTSVTTSEPGSCLVLEEKYCSSGVVVHSENGFPGIAFNLPKGTPIFSPYDGTVVVGNTKEDGSGIPVIGVMTENASTGFRFMNGNESFSLSDTQQDAGIILGYLTEDMLPSDANLQIKGYNLVVSSMKDNGDPNTEFYQGFTGNN